MAHEKGSSTHLVRCTRVSSDHEPVLIELEYFPGHRKTYRLARSSASAPVPRPGAWYTIVRQTETEVELGPVLQESLTWNPHHPWADVHRLRRLHERFSLIRRIRQYFYDADYLEVDTPILAISPGQEPWLDPFSTRYHDPHHSIEAYLPFSPEYGMKKLLSMGFTRIFQIAHAFRNGECSRWHEPEFLMLEFYHAPGDFQTIMTELEQLIYFLNHHQPRLTYQNLTIDLTPPWPRRTYNELFQEYVGFRPEAVPDTPTLRTMLHQALQLPPPETNDRDMLLTWAFLNAVEANLPTDRPVFITHFPASMAALARLTPDEKYAERFELYLGGLEIANGFTELCDPEAQRRRFEKERTERMASGKSPHPIDEQFLFALEWGMPPSGGVAVGVDRLVALFTNAKSLAEVLPFPFRDRFEVS